MNIKIFLDWVLVIALVILSKINKWRVSFITHGSQELLTFLREPHDSLAAQLGDEIKLECQTLQDDTQINWYHNTVRVNPGGRPLPNSLVKVEVINRLSRLVIRKLTPDLQGRYHCKAFNKNAAVRKGAWVNFTTSGSCSNGNQEEDGGNYIKKSGDPFSLNNTERGVKKFIWTKSSSENPYKLTYFNEKKEPVGPNSSNHVQVSPNGSLSIASLNILDQGGWTYMTADSSGCMKQTKYHLEIVSSEADVCGRSDRYIKEVDDEKVNTDAGVVSQIVGGKDAEKGSAPWFVGLCRTDKPKVYCGGTLIGKKWVVTAAHCLYEGKPNKKLIPSKDVSIRVGSHSPDCDINENIPISRVIRHPKENIINNDYDNDIAILELSVPVGNYSDSIKPACLEKSSFYSEEDVYKQGKVGTIVGLGRLDEKNQGGAKTLQTVDVPIVAQAQCRSATSYHFGKNTTICAGVPEGGKDACQGDSGGPYTMKLRERTFLVGVISWGKGCARKGKYGYYVDVGKYYDWLLQEMTGGGGPATVAPTDYVYYVDY